MTRNWTDYPLSATKRKKIHIEELRDAYKERLYLIREDCNPSVDDSRPSNRDVDDFPLPLMDTWGWVYDKETSGYAIYDYTASSDRIRLLGGDHTDRFTSGEKLIVYGVNYGLYTVDYSEYNDPYTSVFVNEDIESDGGPYSGPYAPKLYWYVPWDATHPNAVPANYPPHQNPNNKVMAHHIGHLRNALYTGSDSPYFTNSNYVYYGFRRQFIDQNDSYIRPFNSGSGVTWTDPTLSSDIRPRDDHINELRTLIGKYTHIYINPFWLTVEHEEYDGLWAFVRRKSSGWTAGYTSVNDAWSAAKTAFGNASWGSWTKVYYNGNVEQYSAHGETWCLAGNLEKRPDNYYKAKIVAREVKFIFNLDLELQGFGYNVMDPPLSVKLYAAGHRMLKTKSGESAEWDNGGWGSQTHQLQSKFDVLSSSSSAAIKILNSTISNPSVALAKCDMGTYSGWDYTYHGSIEDNRKGYLISSDASDLVGTGDFELQMTARNGYNSTELDEVKPDTPTTLYQICSKGARTYGLVTGWWGGQCMAGQLYFVIEPDWNYGTE